MAILVIFRFQCNPILFFLFFLCKLTPNTGNCYFCIFLIFLTELSSVLFFEKPIYIFFFGKQSGKSVRVTLYTLLQLSLGTRVPNTKRTLFTSCSHTRHVPVCNSKAICWGSLSPVPSPFQNCLLFWWDEFPPWTLGWFCSPLSETSDHPRKNRRHALQSPQKQVWRLALQHSKLMSRFHGLIIQHFLLKNTAHTWDRPVSIKFCNPVILFCCTPTFG